MKKSYWFLVLLVVPFLIVGLAMFRLPEQVIIHFNLSGSADSLASKYTLFVLPAFNAFMGLGLYYQSNDNAWKPQEVAMQQPSLLNKAIYLGMFFNALTLLLVYIGFQGVSNVETMDPNTSINLLVSVLIIVLGVTMTKTKRGSMIGLRTSWSQASDEAWKVSQRIGGLVFVIVGIIVIVLTLFVVPKEASTSVLVVVLGLGGAIACIWSKLACDRLQPIKEN